MREISLEQLSLTDLIAQRCDRGLKRCRGTLRSQPRSCAQGLSPSCGPIKDRFGFLQPSLPSIHRAEHQSFAFAEQQTARIAQKGCMR